jgi:hypothetical protein
LGHSNYLPKAILNSKKASKITIYQIMNILIDAFMLDQIMLELLVTYILPLTVLMCLIFLFLTLEAKVYNQWKFFFKNDF